MRQVVDFYIYEGSVITLDEIVTFEVRDFSDLMETVSQYLHDQIKRKSFAKFDVEYQSSRSSIKIFHFPGKKQEIVAEGGFFG